MNGTAVLQHVGHSQCEVCNSVITYPDFLLMNDLDYVVCKSFDCRRIMSQKASMAPLLFKSHLEFNKKLIRRRKKNDTDRIKHIDEVTEKERQEHSDILHDVLMAHPEFSEETTHMLVIPSGEAGLELNSDERKKQYIEHLKSIVTEATDYENASEVIYDEHHDAYAKRQAVDQRLDKNPALRSISDKLCCMCKGGCCVSGKQHAYLSVFTMRRYMDNNPALSAEDILSLYLSKVSLESIKDSCINHTVNGCMLPRDLRSDICNGFYCDPLKKYQKTMQDNAVSGNVVAIQRSCTYWNRFEIGVTNEVINVSVIKD